MDDNASFAQAIVVQWSALALTDVLHSLAQSQPLCTQVNVNARNRRK